jgi:putative DNA methylase
VPDIEVNDYYAPGGLEGITVLDPMMGGGTTLHEAIRLGANVIGYDLDPIPVLQARASLAHIPIEAKERAFDKFLRALETKLRPYFGTRCPICDQKAEVLFVLHGAVKSCRCGEAIVLDSFLLREETNGEHKRIENLYPNLEVERGPKRWRIFEKVNARCESCKQPFGNCTNVKFTERYVPLVTVGVCSSHGQFFKAPSRGDIETIDKAKIDAAGLRLPSNQSLRVLGGPKSGDLIKRNIPYYSDLFSPRQLLYISTAKELVDQSEVEHRTWLALLVSTSLEFNSLLCGYKGTDKRRPGAIRHVFSHHAYSFPFTSLESNPVFSQKASGTLRRLFDDRIKDASKWAAAPIERKPTDTGWKKVAIVGEVDSGLECSTIREFEVQTHRFIVQQRDSSHLPLPEGSVDFVVTDPPYFDSVQYSDLSHFFRVWLRWFLPDEPDWHFLPTSSAVAETEANADKFRSVLAAILNECNRVMRRPHGRLIFTFHHWRADAWTQLTLALKSANFRLINSYTVHSENPVSVHIRQLNALKHDSILVFQPKENAYRTSQIFAPEAIQMDDSFSFCRDCAKLLGFLLDSDLDDSQIENIWRTALNN